MEGYELFINEAVERVNEELNKNEIPIKVSCKYSSKDVKKYNNRSLEQLKKDAKKPALDTYVTFDFGNTIKMSLLKNYVLSEMGEKDQVVEKLYEPIIATSLKEELLKRVTFKLVNKKNVDLKKCPHRPFMDLAVVYTIALYTVGRKARPASVRPLITNKILENLDDKVSEEELFRRALRNDKRLFSVERSDLPKYKREDIPETILLSNDKESFGASVILRPGILKDIFPNKNLLVGIPNDNFVVVVSDEKKSSTDSLDYMAELMDDINTITKTKHPLSKEIYNYSFKDSSLHMGDLKWKAS